ncbi:hypothetical protein B0H34DRAFT_731941, partial [Crassisporium funariophilum]
MPLHAPSIWIRICFLHAIWALKTLACPAITLGFCAAQGHRFVDSRFALPVILLSDPACLLLTRYLHCYYQTNILAVQIC